MPLVAAGRVAARVPVPQRMSGVGVLDLAY